MAFLLAVAPLTYGQSEKLGREAPSLQVTNWVSGEPIDLKLAGTNRIHVLLFWETWCDSCMASLPSLVDLQAKLQPRGVELIGICPETPEAVKRFLTNNEIGAKINFPLACDPDRKTFDAYMTAFGQSQVPRVFLVDQRGALVWYGHPLAGLEFVLNQVLAGKFDIEAAKKTLRAEELLKDYFLQVATNSEAAEVRQLGRKIAADGTGNPWLLNNFAWRILQDPKQDKRDVALALDASKSACASTEWARPTFLDTHAVALFSNGDVPEAIRLEKKALMLCTNETLRLRLEQTLKTFEAGQTNKNHLAQ